MTISFFNDKFMGALFNKLPGSTSDPLPRLIVRVRTEFYSPVSGTLVRKTTVRVMRRMSTGFDWLSEDASVAGANEVMSRIVNLNEAKDGLYIVTTVNETRDWETGNVDNYDYRLMPFK